MARPKKEEEKEIVKVVEKIVRVEVPGCNHTEKTEKERLIEVYEFLKSRGLNSLSNLENLISR